MVAEMGISINHSPLDEQRFNVSVARASNVTLANFPAMMDFCQREQIELLVARCPVEELEAVHAMETAGFLLMDTLLYYARDLSMEIPADTRTFVIRPAQAGDEEAVARIAAQAFRGYSSHYHADPRLGRSACDDIYVDWAYRSFRREAANELLVAEDDQVLGFISLKILSPDDVEGPLFAVLPEAQGRGVGRALITGALHWSRQEGARRMLISTQVTNRASQTVWVRVGFSPYQAYYTFHKWFTDQA
jgi:GNAT superfamily N-acetyltransferase